MFLKDISPKLIIRKYGTDDIIKIAKNIGFKVSYGSIDSENTRCFLISDRRSYIKEIAIDELQSSEWIYFEVAFLISWYILRGNNKQFSVKLDYEDFFKEENSDIFDYSCELLLYDLNIRKSLSYVDSKEESEELKKQIKVPDFVLRKSIEKIKEERK